MVQYKNFTHDDVSITIKQSTAKKNKHSNVFSYALEINMIKKTELYEKATQKTSEMATSKPNYSLNLQTLHHPSCFKPLTTKVTKRKSV